MKGDSGCVCLYVCVCVRTLVSVPIFQYDYVSFFFTSPSHPSPFLCIFISIHFARSCDLFCSHRVSLHIFCFIFPFSSSSSVVLVQFQTICSHFCATSICLISFSYWFYFEKIKKKHPRHHLNHIEVTDLNLFKVCTRAEVSKIRNAMIFFCA